MPAAPGYQGYRPWRRRVAWLWLLFALAACSGRGVYHPVRAGESLGEIARRYGQDEVALARINGIRDPAELRAGDRIYVPDARSIRRGQATASKSAAVKSVQPTRRTARPSAENASRQLSSEPATAPRAGAQPLPPLKPDPDRFAWPLRGEILRRFGSSKPFPCKGLEIAVPTGTPVQAAAAGRVIYSGDGIRSFGHMIILKHDDEFYTVYAFNQKNLAAAGSFVSKGERIALSGAPAGETPRLYFEIRRRKEPVDPTFYLP